MEKPIQINAIMMSTTEYSGIKPYECSVCGRAFRSSTKLNSHSCARKSYSCDLCEKRSVIGIYRNLNNQVIRTVIYFIVKIVCLFSYCKNFITLIFISLNTSNN